MERKSAWQPRRRRLAGRQQIGACYQVSPWIPADRSVLRPVSLPNGTEDSAKLGWLTGELVTEQNAASPGSGFASNGLVQLIFLQILRLYIARAESLPPGWLRAITDPRIAPAMRLMHGEPARDWRLADLAVSCGMSRTAFAQYFKAVAGDAPVTCLTQLRMRLAERELREGARPVASIAYSLGYASEAAFSTAFKRVTGAPPSQYRRRRRAA